MAPQWVKEYCEKHELQKMFEEAANAVVKARAEEPAAFLVRRSTTKKKKQTPHTPEPRARWSDRSPRRRPAPRGPGRGDEIFFRGTHAHAY